MTSAANNIARVALISAIAAILCTGCSATAQQSRAAPRPPSFKYLSGPGPYHFRCDAPSGYYNGVYVQIPDGALRVSGQLQYSEILSIDAWRASGVVGVIDSTLRATELMLAVLDPSEIKVAFGRAGGQFPYNSVFASIPGRDRTHPVPFVMSIDESGDLSLTVEGMAAPKLRVTNDRRLMLACSSAKVTFSNVTVSR